MFFNDYFGLIVIWNNLLLYKIKKHELTFCKDDIWRGLVKNFVWRGLAMIQYKGFLFLFN